MGLSGGDFDLGRFEASVHDLTSLDLDYAVQPWEQESGTIHSDEESGTIHSDEDMDEQDIFEMEAGIAEQMFLSKRQARLL
jgi:hypothetical protein